MVIVHLSEQIIYMIYSKAKESYQGVKHEMQPVLVRGHQGY